MDATATPVTDTPVIASAKVPGALTFEDLHEVLDALRDSNEPKPDGDRLAFPDESDDDYR
jgi:hypothetical protein